MDKSEDAFRTISEAAEELDLPQHVLRFWETRFPQIRPLKRGGGRRYYRPDDVDLLRAIRYLLYNEGYTIKGVQRMLKERGVRSVLAMRSEASEGRPTSGPAGAVEPVLQADELQAHAGPAEPMTPAVHSLIAERRERPESPDDSAAGDVLSAGGAPHSRQSPALAPPASMPLQLSAPVWSMEQRRTLEALMAELAECRRILAAAHI